MKDGRHAAKIYLVDGGPKVLASMSEASQKYTLRTLGRMGIEVALNMQVKDYTGSKVTFTNGQEIETETLVWAAGVSASVFEGIPAEWYGRRKRLIVDEYNMIRGSANVYAIGDTCLQTCETLYPDGYPQMAQPAMQQGTHLAKNLISIANGGQQLPFRYFDKGSMAIIGIGKAVADLPKPSINLNGLFAWLAWLFIHLLSLINFRNKLRTLANWLGALATRDLALRFIIRPSHKL